MAFSGFQLVRRLQKSFRYPDRSYNKEINERIFSRRSIQTPYTLSSILNQINASEVKINQVAIDSITARFMSTRSTAKLHGRARQIQREHEAKKHDLDKLRMKLERKLDMVIERQLKTRAELDEKFSQQIAEVADKFTQQIQRNVEDVRALQVQVEITKTKLLKWGLGILISTATGVAVASPFIL